MNTYFCCVRFSFLSIPGEEIGLGKRPRNDLFCVEWDVKPRLNQSIQSDGTRSVARAFRPKPHHHHHHHHHHGRVAGEGRRVVAPPCSRSTARLQSSPVGPVAESFRSWSSQLFRGRPGGRLHVRSGGRLSDTFTWS